MFLQWVTLFLGGMHERMKKGKHGKFDNLWIGPFTVIKIFGNNTFVLQNLSGEEIAGPVNGRFLKYFHTY